MLEEVFSIDPAIDVGFSEEWYLYLAVARALGGRVVLYDKYKEPCVVIDKRAILSLVPHKSYPDIIAKWYNELNGATSSPFMDGKTKGKLLLAVDSAREVVAKVDIVPEVIPFYLRYSHPVIEEEATDIGVSTDETVSKLDELRKKLGF